MMTVAPSRPMAFPGLSGLGAIWPGAALAALLCAPAGAADLAAPAPAAPVVPAVVKDADAPVVYGTLYLWGSALSGTSSTLPPLPAVHLDLSFGDILKNFDGGIMGAVEMRTGRWSLIGDVMFTQVSPNATLPGPYPSDVEVRSRSLTVQGDLLYRVYESEAVDVDLGAGLRFWNLNNRLSIGPGVLPIGVNYSQTENWVDPLLAGRLSARLGGPWSLTLVGDVGGFDVGSQFTWQAIGTVNYKWNDQLTLRAGYRALSVDYENGKFLYDVVMQGPIVGATYRF